MKEKCRATENSEASMQLTASNLIFEMNPINFTSCHFPPLFLLKIRRNKEITKSDNQQGFFTFCVCVPAPLANW